MFGPQTRIKIKFLKDQQEHGLDSLSQRFETFSIHDDANDIEAPPGLENVFLSLVEMVQYPLFYSGLLSKLNINCPRGEVGQIGSSYSIFFLKKVS